MEIFESNIPGCYEVICNRFEDERGSFVKTFHKPTFEELGLHTEFVEEYYSVSKKNVIRGMHFQTPPEDHVKLVYCTSGHVMDVVVDLRKGSPTYGEHAIFDLDAEKHNMVYIPKGMAHGFCVLSEQATMVYKVSTVYASEYDQGIRWDSVGVDWKVNSPVVSERDQALPALRQFASPFVFKRESV